MYLVSDDYGDFKKLMNYKELKGLLVDEIVEHAIENHKEYDFIKYDLEVLSDIAKDKITYNRVIEELKSYGWNVLNVCDIQRGINDLREYVARKDSNLKAFDDVLRYIDEELK
jgi:hypothetical protein